MYQPALMSSSSAAVRVIYDTLETQPGNHAPIEVEVNEEKMALLRARRGFFSSGTTIRTVVRYDMLGEVRLQKKKQYFVSTLFAPTGVKLLHVYMVDERTAQRFMDAVATLRAIALSWRGEPPEGEM